MIAVEQFRRSMRIDKSSWPKNWRVIDMDLSITAEDAPETDVTMIDHPWPSTVLTRSSIEAQVNNIFNTYICDNAPMQICLPACIYHRTIFRIRNLAKYGPEVFMEATIDPIKTIRRDILPRFYRSPDFKEMESRVAQLNRLPSASSLEVPMPSNSLTFVDYKSVNYLFTLNELLCNYYLFQKFLIFLQSRICSESLLCVRMIRVFETKLEASDMEGAREVAWKIYVYFVIQEAAYEISLSSKQRHSITLYVANPTADMFDSLKKSAWSTLQECFEQYATTVEYRELVMYLKKKRTLSVEKAAGGVKSFCKLTSQC